MAKGDFWFKMEWDHWLGDSDLNRCSFATQGFWARCINIMNRDEVSELSGTVDQMRRLLGCTPEELLEYSTELRDTGTADVTIGNDFVTIISRRRKRELKGKEINRLKVQRHREKLDGNHDVTGQSKSKSKSKSLNPNLESREESSSVVAAPPFSEPKPEVSLQPPETDLRKPENPRSSSSHPAVVVYEEIFGAVKPNFAKAISLGVSNLGVWRSLVLEKASYPNPEKWIIGEYQKRVANAPPESRPHEPKRDKTARDFAREAVAQMNETAPQPQNDGTSQPRT